MVVGGLLRKFSGIYIHARGGHPRNKECTIVSESESTNMAVNARARVEDVLKAGLERDLTNAIDSFDFLPSSHGSHVVSATFEPSVVAQEDGELLLSWDDDKFEKFAARLSELQNTAEPLR